MRFNPQIVGVGNLNGPVNSAVTGRAITIHAKARGAASGRNDQIHDTWFVEGVYCTTFRTTGWDSTLTKVRQWAMILLNSMSIAV